MPSGFVYFSGFYFYAPETLFQHLHIYKQKSAGGFPPALSGTPYHSIYTYMTKKWQKLPAITNRWKISCIPKLGWRCSKPGRFKA